METAEESEQGIALMTRLATRLLKLSPAETDEVDSEKTIAIPMPDGVVRASDQLRMANKDVLERAMDSIHGKR
jgi:hypothetical protein